jgi:HD-like signal output (HDOD) protein
MWNWLKKLLPARAYRQTTELQYASPSTEDQHTYSATSAKDNLSDEDISTHYYGLLLGIHSHAESDFNEIEIVASRQLDRMIQSHESRADLVPRLPAIIPQLMQSLRDDDVSTAQLAEKIAKDTTLVVDVINMANSPYYRTTNRIQSLEQAVTMLGHNGVQHILASAAFKPIMNLHQGYFTRLASGYVWRQSEYCAFAAQCIAKKQGNDLFEAYLAGLVRDIGAIVALKAMDNIGDLCDAPRSYKFQRRFEKQSLRLSSLIATEWEFPSNIITALDEQAEARDPKTMSTLGSILYPATLMSQLQVLIKEGLISNDISHFTCRVEGRLTDHCKFCFSELQKYAV